MIALHVVAGAISLISGAIALSARKGGRLHRSSGTAFFWSMLAMALSGAAMATGDGDTLSILAGLLTAYLVVTARLTVRGGPQERRRADALAAAAGCAIGAFGIFAGMRAGSDQALNPEGYPAAVYFAFGGIALIAAALDVRMLIARGVRGAHRTARHLWRMNFALLLAVASFFLGQADVFPETWRHVALLAAPVILVSLSIPYWLLRTLVFDVRRAPR